jgi:SAM-dependent methyltransferase
MSEQVAASYDIVAARYAQEVGDEMAVKPVDRALLNCFAELTGAVGTSYIVADVGCGPGQVASYLAEQGCQVVGVDISPAMVDVARARYRDLTFAVGSLLDLPVVDGGWAGAVCPYSIIHLSGDERSAAFTELARAVAPGGWLLLSFHISSDDFAAGQVHQMHQWWGHPVELDFHFLDPAQVAAEVSAAGFTVMAVTERQPWPGVEHQSRRCHLLAQR